MGLRILHSADWHLDSPFTGFTPEQRAWLKGEQRRIPDKIAQLVRREGCDLMLLSGDVFDGSYTKESAEILRSALERCGVPVLVSPGNHDHLAPGSPWVEEKWPDNVFVFPKNVTSVALPSLDCRIYGAGYESMDCPPLLEGFRAAGEEKYLLAVLHGDPVQLRSPYCPVTAAQARDSGLTYLALGHIHKAGSFRAGDCLCGWPGTPMGRGFDETREKGVYIVDVEEKASLRFVPLDTPRFYELEVDTDRESLADALPGAGNPHFYRVTLTGSGEENLSVVTHFPNLELIDRRERPADPWENAGEDTLEGTYFHLLQEKLENTAPQTERCIRLAAEISLKLLQGREVQL